MAIDIKKFFGEQLPTGIASDPVAAQKIGGKFHIMISDSNGGEWFIDTSSSGLTNTSAATQTAGADVTIVMASEDFQHLMYDPKGNFMQLFFAGKVKCTGNTHLAMKLPDLVMLASQ